MAHQLMHNHMAYVGEVPWHGLGKSVPAEVSAQEMIAAAGLDWQVRKEPALWANNHQMGPYKPYLVVRERTAHESQDVALGFVGHGYEILQNDEAFEFFEPFIDSRLAHFETAGALRHGERVWVLAKLSEPICVVRDDLVDRYLLLSNSHNGHGAVSIRFTPIRVVCQNTLNLAMRGEAPPFVYAARGTCIDGSPKPSRRSSPRSSRRRSKRQRRSFA
jgi:phage/plasmid-like protein (TIGR03299 family)